MPSLFSGSAIVRATVRLGELILLNLCYVLCCLPLFTAGAATAALYAVCFRFGTDREGHPIRSFFRDFRQNLRQGTALWLVLLALSAGAAGLVLVFLGAAGPARLGYIPALVLLLAIQIVAGYAFPLLGLFENTCRGTLKNALILGLSQLPRSICVVAVNLSPVITLLAAPELFARLSIFLIFLFFSGAAYVNTGLLRKVFAAYLPEQTT